MLEFLRRLNELSCNQFTLIVFTQLNGSPARLFYNLVVSFICWLKPMGILQPSILVPFYRLTVYKQEATTATQISHELKSIKS